MNEAKTETDLERSYLEFCGEIAKISSALFSTTCKECEAVTKGIIPYEKGDIVIPLIVLSPSFSFRNRISPAGVTFRTDRNGNEKDIGYKANRKKDAWSIPGVKDLKKMIYNRLKDTGILYLRNIENKEDGAEADDVVNYLARTKKYFVAAIDKDVINANPTYCYDYNNFKWELPRRQHQIEQWFLYQTLMGDATDNIAGAKGIGAKTAQSIIYGELDGKGTYYDLLPYFENETDLLVNHQLVRMDMYNGETVVPWNPAMAGVSPGQSINKEGDI